MATTSNPLQEGIRKTRSAGDIPRVPERAHLHSTHPTAHSEATPSPHSPQATRLSSSNAVQLGALHIPPTGHNPSSTPSNDPLFPQPQPLSPVALPTSNDQLHPQPLPAQRIRLPNVQERPNNAANAQSNGSVYMRLLLYFGLGRNAPHARKALVSLIWTICWDTAQLIIIITMLILVGTHFKSPVDPSLSEWKACDRPLGTWASIWVVRVILALILSIWEYNRDRILRVSRADVETAQAAGHPHIVPDNRHNNANTATHRNESHLRNNSPNAAASEPPTPPLPYSALYSRLTLLSSLMTLSWFLTAHILEYSSVNTCRHSAPHLWWLVFGILCIMYLMVLEVVILGIIVLVIAPILFIFWNILLICLGRHPLQNPHMIKPEIGGLPKSVVERIPLVMYIPPPPEGEKDSIQTATHLYPPQSQPEAKPPQQKRFKLLRNFRSRRSKNSDGTTVDEKQNSPPAKEGADADGDTHEPVYWEDNWEKNDYPFVALEGNRAACAICLLDFEEPKRKENSTRLTESETKPENTDETAPTQHGIVASGSNTPIESPSDSNAAQNSPDTLKLEDAGEGAQPLRLLACGHVFHKTCLDPWLIDVSGRCPICQRPVEVPKPTKKSRWRPI